jgi:type 1 fimbriae regulatory protein FimB/type 1 fimbriae regulatory protein FimE
LADFLSSHREYLTTAEIERLMAAARKSSRYGHRDATMILIGYRHGLLRTCCGMAAAMP